MRRIITVLMIFISSQVYAVPDKTNYESIANSACIESFLRSTDERIVRGIVGSFIIDSNLSNTFLSYCVPKLKKYLIARDEKNKPVVKKVVTAKELMDLVMDNK